MLARPWRPVLLRARARDSPTLRAAPLDPLNGAGMAPEIQPVMFDQIEIGQHARQFAIAMQLFQIAAQFSKASLLPLELVLFCQGARFAKYRCFASTWAAR